jgi:flagellar hook protein FlgE
VVCLGDAAPLVTLYLSDFRIGMETAMGLFDALTTAVTGLQAQSYAMQNISGNIANSQTIAYKGINTNFEDLIPDSVPSKQIAGGVIASSAATNTVQGAIQSATIGTDMAINGNGFFIVEKVTGFSGNTPIFSGVNLYTRRGDFEVNAQGYMVNGAGYYLVGLPIDPSTGNPLGDTPAPLQFKNNFLPAAATSTITYGLNLPTFPQTSSTNPSIANSELLNPANFSVNPLFASVPGNVSGLTGASSFPVANTNTITISDGTGTATVTSSGTVTAQNIVDAVNTAALNVKARINAHGQIEFDATGTNPITVGGTASTAELAQFGLTAATTPAGTGTVVGNDVTTFVSESIDGGSVTAFSANGTPANIQLRWAKVDSATSGGTDQWNLFYQTNSAATGPQVAWQKVGPNFVFDSTGELNPPITNLTLNNVNVNGIALGAIQLNSAAGGITQFANTSGTATINNLQQNGYAAGALQSLAVTSKGTISGSFANGKTVDLSAIPLVHFNSPDNLKALDGGAFAVTDESGPALAGASGQILGQSLEGSNTDIATEFTKLIVTQQAYSANTKVITTANQMSQDLLNILR